jgi:uncharacterized protein (UPF0332 family)
MNYDVRAHLRSARERLKDEGAKIRFGELFVMTGEVGPEFGRALSDAFELRKDADYAVDTRAEISRQVAEEEFRKATEFLMMAEKFLEGAGGNIE